MVKNAGPQRAQRLESLANMSAARARPDFRTLLRAIRYVSRHRRLMVLAYGSLFTATAAQIVVPQLVRVIIDAVVGGAQLQAAGTSASIAQALPSAMLAIVVFSVVRAVFAFGQQYNAERISQNVAFDIRNQLFAKIQRLSFSYLDRHQTGQLMIRTSLGTIS